MNTDALVIQFLNNAKPGDLMTSYEIKRDGFDGVTLTAVFRWLPGEIKLDAMAAKHAEALWAFSVGD